MTDRELIERWIKPGAIVPVNNDTVRILVNALRDRLAQPEWVGLTDEKSIFQEGLKQLEGTRAYCFLLGAKWAEAKLKEKNT